jgi:hypothetical protein
MRLPLTSGTHRKKIASQFNLDILRTLNYRRSWAWTMKMLLYGAASLTTFMLAAKAHGRELRLERVAAGIQHVTFGGDNPAFVDALWTAERMRFWVATPLLSLILIVALALAGASRSTIAFAGLSWAPSAVFMVLGLASIVRAGALERPGLAGSAMWWSLVVLGFVFVALLGRRAGF